MRYFLFCVISFFLSVDVTLADRTIGIGQVPDNSIIDSGKSVNNWGLIDILTFVEAFLLKVILPLVIIGSGLYIAYELFLAEGNEEKNKKAWESLTYAAIGVICIGLAYAVVALISRLSF